MLNHGSQRWDASVPTVDGYSRHSSATRDNARGRRRLMLGRIDVTPWRYCSKSILLAANLLFFLMALMFFGAGLAISFAHIYMQPYVDLVLANIPDLGAGGFKIDLATLTGNFSILCVCTGIIVMIVAIMGMCGAYFNSKLLLYVYAVMLFAMVSFQFVVIFIVVSGALGSKIKHQMRVLVNNQSAGETKLDSKIFIELLTFQLRCCGVDCSKVDKVRIAAAKKKRNIQSFGTTNPGKLNTTHGKEVLANDPSGSYIARTEALVDNRSPMSEQQLSQIKSQEQEQTDQESLRQSLESVMNEMQITEGPLEVKADGVTIARERQAVATENFLDITTDTGIPSAVANSHGSRKIRAVQSLPNYNKPVDRESALEEELQRESQKSKKRKVTDQFLRTLVPSNSDACCISPYFERRNITCSLPLLRTTTNNETKSCIRGMAEFVNTYYTPALIGAISTFLGLELILAALAILLGSLMLPIRVKAACMSFHQPPHYPLHSLND